jgi:tetratricopeptide (TPR) repeat protein
MLDLFNRLGDANLQMVGQWSLGAALFHLGELEVGHVHLQRALDLYDPAFHNPRVWETGVDPGIFCRCELARTLTLRGYPDQGLACVLEAVAHARALEHPQPLAFSLLFLTLVRGARREPEEVCRVFDELSALCLAHGIAQELLWAVPLRGRALVELGEVARGLDELATGLAAHLDTRSTLLRPYYFVLHAGALLRVREYDRARQALTEAREISEATNQHAYDSEHRRLEAEVCLARGHRRDCDRLYQESLAIARGQGARFLELRAARGYASFLADAGRRPEARDVLQICDWFTEGRSTPDFVYAEALRRTVN